jgi:hypothetical protein
MMNASTLALPASPENGGYSLHPRDLTMRIRLTLAVMWTVLILISCWTPADWLPVKESEGSGWHIPNSDKAVHAGMFLVFAVLWLEASPDKKGRFVWVALGGLALAAVTELGQNIPALKRDGEIADALADAAGVVIGLAAYWRFQVLRVRRQTSLSPGGRG